MVRQVGSSGGGVVIGIELKIRDKIGVYGLLSIVYITHEDISWCPFTNVVVGIGGSTASSPH